MLATLVVIALVIVLPVLLVVGLLKLAWCLVVLPFKLLGGLLRLAAGLVGAVGVLLGALLALVLLPLSPLLLMLFVVWLIVRPRPVHRRVATMT